MLDYRLETFLTICQTGSFTKAAQVLHITQPAVSQHIKFLESYYSCKLINSSNRKISLTKEGKMLKEFATTAASDASHFKNMIKSSPAESIKFTFGATLSIGEYVMPEILSHLLEIYPNMQFQMTVANTKGLLERLNSGELDFILVEGQFDKSDYDTTLFSLEDFIPVCSAQSNLAHRSIEYEDLIKNRLILREKGSGTREIFEHILEEHNYSLNAFDKIIEIGNMQAIKQMVANGLGITFLFEVAAKRALQAGELAKIDLLGFSEQREFNFVMLKNSYFRERYMEIYHILKTADQEIGH